MRCKIGFVLFFFLPFMSYGETPHPRYNIYATSLTVENPVLFAGLRRRAMRMYPEDEGRLEAVVDEINRQSDAHRRIINLYITLQLEGTSEKIAQWYEIYLTNLDISEDLARRALRTGVPLGALEGDFEMIYATMSAKFSSSVRRDE